MLPGRWEGGEGVEGMLEQREKGNALGESFES